MPDESWNPAKAQTHLRIQSFSVPVSDLHRSLDFYETTLGFRVLRRHIDVAPGIAFAAVAPTDGTAVLLLSTADPYHRMGTATGVLFVTTDLDTQHREWANRGVRFSHQPRQVAANVRVSTFLDPDDNAFLLSEVDSITTSLEAEHRALAERADRDRRAAHELEIATQVQAGLFPSQRPVMRTLDYAGVCLQARQVGGDYFDFLDCGDGRLGLVIGDVSGKGLGAALLMANLQAHLRSHYPLYRDDLPALLASVNHLFQQSTPAASYATVCVCVYDDQTRRLRWLNCGHPPPVVLRRNGTTEWLDPTAYPLGMFDHWEGVARETELEGGDVVALYTDGVSEALHVSGKEFGAEGVVETLRAQESAGAQAVLDRAIKAVLDFTQGEQHDDITMLVATVA
jgi:serine phosphatase RsbU (regulator of sigma subunit)/predicted enzyme related to lactoylglutathione lyase